MEIKAFGLESLQNFPEITAQLSEREKELLTFFFFFNDIPRNFSLD